MTRVTPAGTFAPAAAGMAAPPTENRADRRAALFDILVQTYP